MNKYKINVNKKHTKTLLFERMSKIGGMLINENNFISLLEDKNFSDKILFFENHLMEIDTENTFGDVGMQCLRPDKVVEWLNDELNRLNYNKANPSKRQKRGVDDTIVTRGNIEQLTNDDGEVTKEALDIFINNITKEPKSIFEHNPKMEKSDVGRPQITVNTGIPALSAIVYDTDNNKFYNVSTCPSAGSCKIGCYARKAFYGMDDSKTMLLTQRINLLLNDPTKYEEMIYNELKPIAEKAKMESIGYPNPIRLLIRWNDAGDFFAQKYIDIAKDVTERLVNEGHNVMSYAYTKSSKYIMQLDKDNNFVVNFSTDASKQDQENVLQYDQKNGTNLKKSHTVAKGLWKQKGFFRKTDRGHLAKGSNGLPMWASQDAPNQLKNFIYEKYNQRFDISRDSLRYTYELPNQDEGGRKYNVIVLPSGDSDIGAQRNDVKYSFLLEH